MLKHLRIATITIILGLLVFSCTSTDDKDSKRPSKGRPQERQEQMRPEPTEAEMSLIHLQGLIDIADEKPELAITPEQAKVLLPILEDWKAAVKKDSDEPYDKFVAGIAAEMTKAQRDFNPELPEGGKEEIKAQRPPSGGPEKIDMPSLLSDLIKEITRI